MSLLLQEKRFIINVSAMEGKFNWVGKPTTHPHTNTAKASLNMQTRTSAPHYAKSNIFMTAVDTGWVSDMRSVDDLQRIHGQIGLHSRIPLDEIDGAARVLDPVRHLSIAFSGVLLTIVGTTDFRCLE